MKVKTKAAINSLNMLARQFEKLTLDKVDNAVRDQAVNTVVGCFHIIARSPTTDIRVWLGRKPHRKSLKSATRAVQRKQGIRAIRELINLAISELEANRVFWPEVEVGPLPVKEPRRTTQAQLRPLREANAKRALTAKTTNISPRPLDLQKHAIFPEKKDLQIASFSIL